MSQPQIPLFALNSMFFLIRVFSQMASSVCNLNCSHYVGVIWSYFIFIVLQTPTCSPGGWNPAGWVLWCLVSNRWYPHPGKETKETKDVCHIKSEHIQMRQILYLKQEWVRAWLAFNIVDNTDPLHFLFVRQPQPVTNTSVHLRKPTWAERKNKQIRLWIMEKFKLNHKLLKFTKWNRLYR